MTMAPPNKLKVLYIHHDPNILGSSISLRNLLSELDRTRFLPRILLATDGPSRKLYEDLQIPVDVISIRGLPTFPGYRWNSIKYWKSWLSLLPNWELENYLRRIKPDIVHINDKMVLIAGITAKKLNLPVVWHLRSSYNVTHSKLAAFVSKTMIKKNSDRIIAISEDEIDGFEDVSKVKIIHNSVDLLQAEEARKKRETIRKEFGLANDEIAVSTVTSTINEVRGTWDFIRSAGLVHKQLPFNKIKFFIVARIPQKKVDSFDVATHPLDQANFLIKENDLEGCLTLTGFRDDPLAVMAGMDIVVVCNRHGVLGRMPFEAMSVGTPVVATSGHSGKSSVVVDMENAVVVRPADPESIADGIIRLIGNVEFRQKLSEKGLIYSYEHFDPQKNARLVEGIYEEVSRSKTISG